MVVLPTPRHRRRALSITPRGAAQPGAHLLTCDLRCGSFPLELGCELGCNQQDLGRVLVCPYGNTWQCCWRDCGIHVCCP